jgi:hypothetical protein
MDPEKMQEAWDLAEAELIEVREERDTLVHAIQGVLVELAMASNGDTRHYATFEDVYQDLKQVIG